MNRLRRALVPGLAALLALAACGDDSTAASGTTTTRPSSTGSSTGAGSTGAGSTGAGSTGAGSTGPAATTVEGAPGTTIGPGTVTASGISPDRCEANRKAGTITYLSGFDFAASASIVEVVVAKAKGYFAAMCLDVQLRSSFSTANYPLVSAGQAQFASAGSYVELLNFNAGGGGLVAVVEDGKTGIDELLVKPSAGVTTTADLKGKTIGVKGALPPSLVAMLAKAGLRSGVDTREVLLDGFDPVAHWKLPIDALPGYKSNEPLQLDRAGIRYGVLDPSAAGIPGSFGLIYTSRSFVAQHPSAAQDFVRAALRGLADAMANPDEAATICFQAITAGGNKNFLSDEGERSRWKVESQIVRQATPAGQPIGVVDAPALRDQVAVYAAAGVFKQPPATDGTLDTRLAAGSYGPDGALIWPAS
jgi:NitT/TauT family transport system substrate-binding protein